MLDLMITVINRARLPELIKLSQANDVSVQFVALGRGTATGEVLGYFGLEQSEKAVCLAVVTPHQWKTVKHDLEQQMQIDIPGTGVAFTVPMSSIGGPRELAFLTNEQHFTCGEETTLKHTDQELLVVIGNQGYNDLIMDAARSAGARGGTVLHAQGTGMEKAEQFLGISLASEKDVVLIVTKTKQKNSIMRSIMEKAGLNSKAKSIVFSLPVTDTAGLRLTNEEDEEESEKNKTAE